MPCTLSPASTWILAPVILVFFANMMNASAQSWRSVSCLSAAVSFAHWIFSSEYFLPCTRALDCSRINQRRKTYPFRQQQPGQYGVHAYLGALRRAEALDELQLCRLRHGVRHRGAGLGHGSDGAAADEGAAVRVGFEGRLCGFEEGEGRFDVSSPALGLLISVCKMEEGDVV